MNPIVFSALYGLLKGYASPGAEKSSGPTLHTAVLAPLREEMAYRAPLANVAPGSFNEIASTIAFGLAHFDPSEPTGYRAIRVIDAGLGGLAYTRAFRAGGIGNAVLAHALHNFMVGVGSNAAKHRAKKKRGP